VTSDEIYAIVGLIMLMSIVQKPTLKLYFSRDAFVDTTVFLQIMIQGGSNMTGTNCDLFTHK
jgi:hypothetical protein